MTEMNTAVARRVVSAVALVVMLTGACSPAPEVSKEAAVDAFNRHDAPASKSAPAPAPAATVDVAAVEAKTPAVDVANPPLPAKTAVAVPVAQAAPAAAPRAPQAAPTATVQRVGGLPDTPGRATVQRVCSSCHAMGMVTAKGRTEDGWSEVIGKMIGNGLEASDDDLQTVHAYLTREFPPK